MLKLVELALQLKEDGTIEIPIEALEQMGILTGEEIQLIYMAESEDNLVNASKEFLLTRTAQDVETEMTTEQEVSFQVPVALLKDAGIPLEADLEIVCRNGKIIILPAEEAMAEKAVPEELRCIFEELGISSDKVQVILKTAEEDTDGKTDL